MGETERGDGEVGVGHVGEGEGLFGRLGEEEVAIGG